MNFEHIPTPETDANKSAHDHFECYGYENSLDTPMVDWHEFAIDLERRLTVAREALEKFSGCFDCYECTGTAETALTLTAPKP